MSLRARRQRTGPLPLDFHHQLGLVLLGPRRRHHAAVPPREGPVDAEQVGEETNGRSSTTVPAMAPTSMETEKSRRAVSGHRRVRPGALPGGGVPGEL